MPVFIRDIEELPSGGFYIYGAGAVAHIIKDALAQGEKSRSFLGFLTSFADASNPDEDIFYIGSIAGKIRMEDQIIIGCQYAREIAHNLTALHINASIFDAMLLVFKWPLSNWSVEETSRYFAQVPIITAQLNSDRSKELYQYLFSLRANTDGAIAPTLYADFYKKMDNLYGEGDAYDRLHYFEYDIFDGVKYVVEGGSNIGAVSRHLLARLPADGKLFSFEPMQQKIQSAFRGHPVLGLLAVEAGKNRYQLIEEALWSERSELFMAGSGSNFSNHHLCFDGDPSDKVSTISIDEFNNEQSIERIDFIKLDVEGAEPHVLAGAADCLRKHRPALAISIYHGSDQFVTIPEMLMRTLDNYEFEIGHHSNSPILETVLYCKPL